MEALPRHPAALRPPRLRVAVAAGAPDDPTRATASVHVSVSGGRAPVRLHFYVDGELAATQSGTGMVYDLPVGRVASGSHTIGVRVRDALGRRADASMQLELPLRETTLDAVAAGGTAGRLRRLVATLWR